MPDDTPATIYLDQYAATDFVVSHVDLDVRLDPENTRIHSRLLISRREGPVAKLVLDGEDLRLEVVKIDDRILDGSEFIYVNNKLEIHDAPVSAFTLEITQHCNPKSNTALSGLYLSNGAYCTQMEAEGFRRFAFMYDRPDVMATYNVRIEAPKQFPVILCNGNLVTHGECSDGKWHFAEWNDPHPKPTYLFALVAGDFAGVHDTFLTSENRTVALGIYVEKGKEDRCEWAMQSLKTSMLWDEKRFGRAYDLDVFNIVAVSDFNMGAMENKGLNIFNDKYILARPDTATDTDYINIERIIAHEYFHNWTGNRITCRDWFQLCLKEGLTVFRDQEFTADMRSRAVKRIEDVRILRARQFPEDQGPLAHSVRPRSYIEINNFYTPTIYEKGAEICSMLHTLLGGDIFRKAMDLYFDRHDGEAATVENFLQSMEDASGRNLDQFAKWYEQAGTPVVDVKTSYDAGAREFKVELSQHTPDTPNQNNKTPLHMPLALALFSGDGAVLKLHPKENLNIENGVFEFLTANQTLTFTNIAERPLLSINRNFSAPIVLRTDATESDLLQQMAVDNDSFNRWEAAQTSAMRLFTDAYRGKQTDVTKFANGLKLTLANPGLDDAFKALMLQLPSEAEITVAICTAVDAKLVHETRREILQHTAILMITELQNVLQQTDIKGPYRPDVKGTALRSLRGATLTLLGFADGAAAISHAEHDFANADNMTLEVGAVSSILALPDPRADEMLDRFFQRHSDDPLLVDKWLVLKSSRANSAQDIEALTRHPAFTFRTPNRVYALIGGFTGGNLKAFHAADGTGYRLLGECIKKLNAINPQVAARMANGFRSWGRYDEARKTHAAAEMQRILIHSGLSNDVYEIISRTLNS